MSIETNEELEAMRRVGRIVRKVIEAMEKGMRPGMTTAEVGEIGGRVMRAHGARSAPKLVYGFPGDVLVSVNEEAIHGVPGTRVLRAGDLVKLDVTAEKDGFMADAAVSVVVPPATERATRLAAAARAAFQRGLAAARPGAVARDIGREVEAEVRRRGFHVLRDLNGHGIGRTIHEEPSIPGWDDPRCSGRLTEGLVITIEPIVGESTGRYREGRDGWTVSTADGSWAAHYEHTLVVMRGKPILLTAA